MTDNGPSKDLVSWVRHWCDCARVSHEETGRILQLCEEVERLRTTLTGIQSCSTCEACRVAASFALDGYSPDSELARLRRENDQLHKQVVELSTHAEKWVKRATTPAHEREMPHCSTCSCPPYPAATGTVLARLRDLRHVAEASGQTVWLSADNILDVLAEIDGRDRRIAELVRLTAAVPAQCSPKPPGDGQ